MQDSKSIKGMVEEEAKKRQSRMEEYSISMTVNDDSSFLSEFSSNDTPVISRAVAEFIEDSTPSVRQDEVLTLKIKSSCIDNDEKKIYSNAIKEYYMERYIASKKEIKRNYMIAAALAIVGILVLALAIFVGYHSTIWSEIIDIVAWVFVWEAVYIAFLETRKLKQNNRKYIAYLTMKIKYIDAQ